MSLQSLGVLEVRWYASFAKTGKERRFWQKRHTGDVSKVSELFENLIKG